MAAPPINSDIIIAGILRFAKSQPDPLAWLMTEHKRSLDAVLSGAEFVRGVTFSGNSNEAEQNMPATLLLELLEAALQVYESQNGGGELPGSIRHGDFSAQRCMLG